MQEPSKIKDLNSIADFVKQQGSQGVRGIIIGEKHSDITLIPNWPL